MAISAENRARAEVLARKIVELTGGRFDQDGRPKTFDQIENEATELGDLITSLAIQKSVAPDEHPTPQSQAEVACPMCDRPCSKRSADDDEAMMLQASRGEVQWMAEGYYCRRCRRSFFPSAC